MRLQPDLIKLDRSLVAEVDKDAARAALIEFFVVFARRIGAAVCCEGIETAPELAALAALDVRLGQGYLLGRPAPPWGEPAPEATKAMGALRAVGAGGYGDASAKPINRRLGRAARR
jgi:EAL domain-containing protein (putative c-di-GMP-specific phosphodiesterase class I)